MLDSKQLPDQAQVLSGQSAAHGSSNGHANGTNDPVIKRTAKTRPTTQAIIEGPPNSLDAEQSTLGAMLLEAAAIAHAQSTLIASDFYRQNHRIIFSAMLEIDGRGEPVDLITLVEELRRRAQLEEVAGAAYLTALIETCPSSANVESYASIVQEKAQRRAEILAADTVRMLATSDAPAEARADALASLIKTVERAASNQKSRYQFHALGEVEEQPARPMLIQKIFPVDCLAAIVGKFGSFKSFLGLDMALSIATGRAWQGLEVEKRPVVYIAAEGGGEIGKRTRAWRTYHQCDRPKNFHFLTEPAQLMNEADAACLARELQKLPEPPGLIVIDTLARCLVGGDENSAKDMGLFIAGADALRRATGATVLIIHHAGKSGDTRGSTSLPGAMDAMIEVKAEGDYLTLTCAKQKDAAPFAPFSLVKNIVQLGDGDTSLVFDIAGAGAIPTTPDSRRESERAAFEVLSGFPNGATATQWEKACKEVGVPSRTFYEARDSLIRSKSVNTTATRPRERGAIYSAVCSKESDTSQSQ